MSTRLTVTFTIAVEVDCTVSAFRVNENGIPPEDNPKSPEGIVGALLHNAVRIAICDHNARIFTKAVARSRS